MQFDEAECCCTSRRLGNNKSERNGVMIQELLLFLLLLSSCRMFVWSVSWECAESREVLPSASQAPIQQLHSLQCILHCRYSVEWGEGAVHSGREEKQGAWERQRKCSVCENVWDLCERDSVKVWWAVKIKVWKKGAKCTKTFKINKINLREMWV